MTVNLSGLKGKFFEIIVNNNFKNLNAIFKIAKINKHNHPHGKYEPLYIIKQNKKSITFYLSIIYLEKKNKIFVSYISNYILFFF